MKLEELSLPLNVMDTGFKTGIGAAIAGVTALIGAMGMAVKATFDWANQLDSIQDIIGGTNEEAAALNFTLRKSGVSTETFNRSMTILSKGLVKADGSLDTVGKSLASWGINVKDASGNLKSQSQILDEASKKYNSFATQQERVNFLTEAFGRGGAEMVDFFDTLAGEGGIDAVTAKVERLGLVIDPQRYENFTRALEELKLVGLGLAVGFTEKVMPAFERFLEIITGPGTLGQKASELFANLDAYIGNAIGNMAVAVENWVAGGGPEELSNKLISWIENIGTGDQSRILTAAGKLITALGTALVNVDWSGIGIAIDTKLAETLDAIDWNGGGAAFGRGLDSLFAFGLNDAQASLQSVTIPAFIQSLFDGINKFFLAAVGADQFGGWKAYFDAWGLQIQTGWNDLMNKFKNMAAAAIRMWGQFVLNALKEEINHIIGLINSIPVLPNIPMITANIGGSIGSSVGGGNLKANARASGGPVIAGQSYNVAEFYKPERFTPSVNGRVDPMGGDDIMTTLSFMMQDFADKIARANMSMVEKVGR